MKKLLLAGFITGTLVLSSTAIAFADDTQNTAVQPLGDQTQVSATTTPSSGTAAAAETATTTAPAVTVDTTTPATTPATSAAPAQTETSKAGLIKQLRDAVEQALVKDIDPQVVSELRAKNYSYSKIALIDALSKVSGKTVDEVSTVVDEHKGLGEIAQLLGIKVNDIKTARKEINAALRQGLKDFASTVKQDESAIKDKIAELKGDVKKDREAKQDLKKQEKKDAEAAVVSGIDPTVVDGLRAKGYGYGQIALINALAQKSGKSIDDVVAALQQYKGYGETVKALGLKPADLKDILKSIRDQRKAALSQDKEKLNDENAQLQKDKKQLNNDRKELKSINQHKREDIKKFERNHGWLKHQNK